MLLKITIFPYIIVLLLFIGYKIYEHNVKKEYIEACLKHEKNVEVCSQEANKVFDEMWKIDMACKTQINLV